MNEQSRVCAGRAGLMLSAALTAGMMALPVWAQDSAGQTQNARQTSVPSGPFGAFAELNYGSVQQDDSVAYPASNDVVGATFGVLIALPDIRAVMIPSLLVERSSGEGANPFATTEATGAVVGGDVALAMAVAPDVRLHLGAGVGTGEQEVVFNGADVSVTDLMRYSARVGLSGDVYADDGFTLTLSNMLEWTRLNADYAPTNSVDRSSATVLANNLKLTGTWDVTEATSLNASATFVHLFIAEPLAGDNPFDENYGILSLGASHDLDDQLSVYGNAGVVVGGIRQGSVTAKLGIATYF